MITNVIVVLNLILLEVLLSVDNAAVLAVMVKGLPENQRVKALRYGILGAYLFRGLFLFAATWLVTILWLKIIGGLYLIYLVYQHFTAEEGESSISVKKIFFLSIFWSTVVWVEIADIAFSLDNIFAAVALSDNIYIVITGVFIGILGMRFAAQWFVVMIEKHPSLNDSAFIVIGLLGVKLVISGAVDYIPDAVFMRHLLENHYTDLAVSALTLIIFFSPLLFSKKIA